MSLKSRRELAASVALHYKAASKPDKGRMLDQFVLATSYNRKYAIGLLDNGPVSKAKICAARLRSRKYGPDVEERLLSIWRLSGDLCPKRLMPFLAEFIQTLERFDELCLCPMVRAKLLTMSVSTAERLLQHGRRSQERGLCTTLPGTLLRQQIPIRTYEDWTENRPGFMEIDLVAHGDASPAGDYCYTLTMTDICTGWTECVAISNRSQIAVEAAIEQVRRRLPFALLGIDSDNGAEFINHNLKKWCDKHRVTFTRCRPYKKNDQCHVEQKNGAVVRTLVGYARYSGAAARTHLDKLYAVHRLLVNYFEPSMKLTGKTRTGAKVKKSYDTPQTPWQRLQNASVLDEAAQERIKQSYLQLNPAKLRRNLYTLEIALSRFASPCGPLAGPAATPNTPGRSEGGSPHGQDA